MATARVKEVFLFTDTGSNSNSNSNSNSKSKSKSKSKSNSCRNSSNASDDSNADIDNEHYFVHRYRSGHLTEVALGPIRPVRLLRVWVSKGLTQADY